MMLKLLLFYALTVVPALSETLLSGAIYFDSKNTLIEVQDLVKSGNTNGLATLFKAHHIRDKVTQDQEIILLVAGPEPNSPVEFRFSTDPTTYWTYAKYVVVNAAKPAATAAATPAPSLSPGPNSTLPADLPSSLAATAPPSQAVTPAPIPVREPEKEETETHPPLIKHHHRVDDDNEEVPESAMVWHQVNGHWKWYNKRLHEPEKEEVPKSVKIWALVDGHWGWYDKRKLHEVRRALPVSGTPIAAIPTPAPSPPSNVPRTQPVRPGQ
jgi:hypothetical protein